MDREHNAASYHGEVYRDDPRAAERVGVAYKLPISASF